MEHRPKQTRAAVRWAPVDLALLFALGGVIVAVTYVYVTAERAFYYWDHAFFQELAWSTASAFRASFREGWQAVGRSLLDDYNALYALPLIPLLLVLGDSRLAYETSLALVYLLPFALAVGLLATRVASEPSRLAFWTGAWFTLLVSASWVPTLRGYPDAGGAALVVLAVCAYLGDEARRSRRTAALVGALLALAVLFRRHFLYTALALVLSAVLDEVVRAAARARGGGGSLGEGLAALGRRLAAGAFGAVITAVVVGLGFLERMRAYDFRSLYRGYEEPASVVLRWYVAPYGGAAIALALAGVLAGLRWGGGLLSRARLSFLALFTAVAALQWVFAVRQLGEQYTLQFTPFVVIGLAALLWTLDLRLSRPQYATARALLTMFLAANAILGLSNLQAGPPTLARRLFAGGWVPLYSLDYDAIRSVVEYLRENTKPDEAIFVVASSHSLNPDLFRRAERMLHGRDGARLRVPPVPQVDSRDVYPLGALLEADHVVMARPFQGHLRPEEQHVLRVVYELFEGEEGLARDFIATPASFRMDDGAQVSLYRRRRPTDLATALETLGFIEQRVPSRPGSQPDWVVVNRRFNSWLTRNRDGSAAWAAHPAPSGAFPSTVLAYLGKDAGPIAVSGTVTFLDGRCAGATLALGAADATGQVHPLGGVGKRPGEDGRFTLTAVRPSGQRLVLSLLEHGPGESIDYCLLKLDPLVAQPGSS